MKSLLFQLLSALLLEVSEQQFELRQDLNKLSHLVLISLVLLCEGTHFNSFFFLMDNTKNAHQLITDKITENQRFP